VKNPDEKGSFSTSIAQDVLDEALKAVEKRSTQNPGEAAAEPAVPAGDPTPPKDPKDEEIESLKMTLEFSQAKGRELMGKIKDEHEKMLRAAADLDNYKKRALKEKEEVQRFGIEKLLKDFLPVIDNLDRALAAVQSAADFESLKKGVEMTRKLFEDTLGKHGVRSFSSKGQPFDPSRHEAMTAVETDELPPNHVHTEALRGFMLNDRLVRPALVVVSRTPTAPKPTETEAPSGSAEEPKQ
jgi:molecular chaperone GrpE